jgi:hypothetical protein
MHERMYVCMHVCMYIHMYMYVNVKAVHVADKLQLSKDTHCTRTQNMSTYTHTHTHTHTHTQNHMRILTNACSGVDHDASRVV